MIVLIPFLFLKVHVFTTQHSRFIVSEYYHYFKFEI